MKKSNIFLTILVLLAVVAGGYLLTQKKIPEAVDDGSVKIVAPNGGESILTTDTFKIKYYLPTIAAGDVAELYLVDQSNDLIGFIGDVTKSGTFSWAPKDLKHHGGLDNSVRAPKTGKYKVLLLIRTPLKQPEGMMEITVKNIDGGSSVVSGKIMLTGFDPDKEHPGIKGMDLSDDYFTITNSNPEPDGLGINF